ncbi:MAG: sodium:proton antiporter NhaD [Bacteroidales bacterium]|jgi:Na+/H+ antiporter NhaD/arsenite permease-like protein
MSAMLLIFVFGYICIAMEHRIRIDKAAIALVMSGLMWALLIVVVPQSAANAHATAFQEFLEMNPFIRSLGQEEIWQRFITDFLLIEYMGDISSTLFFLIGAMTIVELIDAHRGFDILTDKIKPGSKRKLLVIIVIMAFCMSAVLDNLTTSIVMVTLVRKIVANYKERWVFAGMIIISANSGGAWSPIGDITTIMLWIKGTLSSWPLIKSILLPSIVSTAVPLFFATRLIKDEPVKSPNHPKAHEKEFPLSRKERKIILVMGIASLLSVPVFKYVTSLPPFAGVMTALGIMWIYTEILYSKIKINESAKNRVTKLIKRIDTTTILFFLGILLSVMSLQASGILGQAGAFLDHKLANSNLMALSIGVLSSIVDNVPLVAVAMGMFPVSSAVGTEFLMDGNFWHLLAFCAGTGGSLLIIGSAAGVVVMGLEKISFGWYFKNISLLAFIGYISGALVFFLMN